MAPDSCRRLRRWLEVSRADKFINELVSLAKDLSPQAEVKVSTFSREGEDATIKIYVPSDRSDEVDDALNRRSYEILMEQGYQILPLVYERDEVAPATTGTAGEPVPS